MTKKILLDEILTIERDGFDLQLESNAYPQNTFHLKCDLNSIQLNVCFEVKGANAENISCQIRLEFLEPHKFVDGSETHLWQDYSGCPYGKIEFHADLLEFPLRVVQIDNFGQRFVECHAFIQLNVKPRSFSLDSLASSLPNSFETTSHLDLSKFYNDAEFCDLEIRVGKQTFMASKLVLCLRSPKFESIIRESSNKNCIYLKGIDEDAFELVLRHIYCIDIELSDYCQVERLLIATFAFRLEELQNQCEEHLCKLIDFKNVVDLLQLANKFNLEHLKKQALQFLDQNFTAFMGTDEWLQLLDDKQLATEVCGAIAKKSY